MLKDDDAFKELFDPDEIAAVNITTKQPIYSTFTWTQNLHTLDKARVPKEVKDLLKQFKVEKERLDKLKQTLPPINSDSKRKDDSSLTTLNKQEQKSEVKPRIAISNELSGLSKKRADISLIKSIELFTEDTVITEENSRKHLRSLPRKRTKQSKRVKVNVKEKLTSGLDSIDNLVKFNSASGPTTIKSFVSELVKDAKSKRLLNPEKYLKESEQLFNTGTILSKAALRKSQELQDRIAESHARLNPNKANLFKNLPEQTSGPTGQVIRPKFKTPSPDSSTKIMINKLKTIAKSHSQLDAVAKRQSIPFTLIHTLGISSSSSKPNL